MHFLALGPRLRRVCRPRWLIGSLLLLGTAGPAAAIDLQLVTECSTPSPYIYCMFGEPALSPDGQCVAFTDGTTYPPYWEWWPGIVFVSPGGGPCGTISFPSLNNWYLSPAWSPDGSRLAFISQGWDGPNIGIWTIAIGDVGNPPPSLTHVVTSSMIGDPAWSPDGAAIAYVGTEGIYVAPSTGGGSALVAAGGRAPSWGPDQQIVFERDADLWIRKSDGSERRLTQTPSHEVEPAWSPQGVWIAYSSDQGGDYDIWVIAATGGTPVRVTSTPANEGHPSWSARGDRLVYASTQNEHDSIWMATNLPDWTIGVESRSWGSVKQLYR